VASGARQAAWNLVLAALADLRYRIQHKFMIIYAANAGDVLSVADVNLLAIGESLRAYLAFLAAWQQLGAGATGLARAVWMIFIADAFAIYLLFLVSVLSVAGFACASRRKCSYLGVTFVALVGAAGALHAVGVFASQASASLGELVERGALEASFAPVCGVLAVLAVALFRRVSLLAGDAGTVYTKKEAWFALGALLLAACSVTRQTIGIGSITCFTSLTVQGESSFALLAAIIRKSALATTGCVTLIAFSLHC
jgi:hypothetical protein